MLEYTASFFEDHTPGATYAPDETLADAITEALRLTFTPAQRRGINKRGPNTKPKRTRYVPRYLAGKDLGRTVGVEVTFIPAGYEADEARHMTAARDAFYPLFRSRAQKAFGSDYDKRVKQVSCDPDVIEIPTAIHKKRHMLVDTLTKLHEVADGIGMEAHNDWHGGGGAHVHVGIKPEEWGNTAFMRALYFDLTHRPYLTWAFCNKGDHNASAKPECMAVRAEHMPTLEERECKVRYARAEFKRVREEGANAYQREKAYVYGAYPNHKPKHITYRNKYLSDALRGHAVCAGITAKRLKKAIGELAIAKGGAAGAFNAEAIYADAASRWKGKEYGVTTRHQYNTVEWRMFRATDSVEGYMRQVNFALAYMEHINRVVTKGWGKVVPPYQADATKLASEWNIHRAVKGFKATLRMIGLRVRDYADDIQNMREYFVLHMPKECYTYKAGPLFPLAPLTGKGTPIAPLPVAAPVAAPVPYQRRGKRYNSPALLRRAEVNLVVGDFVKLRCGHIAAVTQDERGLWAGVYIAPNGANQMRPEWAVVEVNGKRILPGKRVPQIQKKPKAVAPADQHTQRPATEQEPGTILRANVDLQTGDLVKTASGTHFTVERDSDCLDMCCRFGVWGSPQGIVGRASEADTFHYRVVEVNGLRIID